MEADPDKEEMEDVGLNNERDYHWRVVFEDNEWGIDNEKSFIHDNKWDLYISNKYH